jgi:hypothetical protein
MDVRGGVMTRIVSGLFALLLVSAVGAPALADHPESATREELRQLRAEVNRLDDSLSGIEDDSPRADEFRRREAEIRDELERLSERMRRHERDAEGLGASKASVDALRREVVDLRQDIDASYDRRASSSRSTGEVPDGTEIRVRLEEGLSSRTARVEDRVQATVSSSVRQDGRVAIPAGAEVVGFVQDVQPARRPSQGGKLELSFESMTVDGRRVPIEARLVSLEESDVDKRRAGLGAVIGGVLGAVLDGGKGALIGAILGGSGAVVASGGEEVELPAGTVLTLQLERPLALARR